MLTDLNGYRAPRSPWPWIIGAAIAFAALTFVGPADFAAELEVEAEAKVLRAELAKAFRAPPSQINQERKVPR